ncbi:molybdopterin-dependent oxidoreductase [Actinoplanes sp. TBRC 11911]|uniref:molybdopterin-dependent oxidoreductase n=1 Tax=Actinoplanes sp. TBRC 11911 TaxID=2729386 RepID=UPI00145E91C1|nr:molybdopterin-dependent oxidoreductase [Actinoplanes sp. TBRC 11911]NMO57040.1 molybdopterin-dependent oxidoreductase [Actinoplanes sp. TBRC 11911]
MKLSVRAGLSGVVAAGVAVGVAEIVAVVSGPLSSPLLAVGGVVVDNVPESVKSGGIQIFGVHDKTALIVGTAVLLGVYSYGVGVLALRRWWQALAGIGLFAAIGVASAMTRHDASAFAWLPTIVGAGLSVLVLRYLLGLAGATDTATAIGARRPATAGVAAGRGGALSSTTQIRPAAADGPDHDEPEFPGPGAWPVAYSQESRRRFLQVSGTLAVGAVVAGFGGRLLTARRAVTAERNAVVLPAPRQSPPMLPAGVQAPGAVPYVTSNNDFYRIDTSLYPPQVDPSTWELRIHGMVRNPITLSWDQLLQRPMIERYITMTCVSNEVGGDLVSNALWLGTPIKELLDEAGVLPGADQVIQRSVDGWTCGTPTAALTDGRDALLVVGMNGEPLPVKHGFPVRMVVPGLYGYVSGCKWITEIELSRFSDFDSYWVRRGYAQQAPIKTESRIDAPRDGSNRQAGTVMVAGVAWAQQRGIAKVEVRVDDGAWQPATLAATVSSDTWREWTFPWAAPKGTHTLTVRATDTTGATQTSTPADEFPDGATGWHSIQVEVD